MGNHVHCAALCLCICTHGLVLNHQLHVTLPPLAYNTAAGNWCTGGGGLAADTERHATRPLTFSPQLSCLCLCFHRLLCMQRNNKHLLLLLLLGATAGWLHDVCLPPVPLLLLLLLLELLLVPGQPAAGFKALKDLQQAKACFHPESLCSGTSAATIKSPCMQTAKTVLKIPTGRQEHV